MDGNKLVDEGRTEWLMDREQTDWLIDGWHAVDIKDNLCFPFMTSVTWSGPISAACSNISNIYRGTTARHYDHCCYVLYTLEIF